jgi:hypothetical protein
LHGRPRAQVRWMYLALLSSKYIQLSNN